MCAPPSRYKTAIRTATPFVTCSRITDRRGSSATSLAISTPRFIGPGCMMIALLLARANSDAIIMHPGPMNRGVEIASDVADDPRRSVILEQVTNGVAVRMAVLYLLGGAHVVE